MIPLAAPLALTLRMTLTVTLSLSLSLNLTLRLMLTLTSGTVPQTPGTVPQQFPPSAGEEAVRAVVLQYFDALAAKDADRAAAFWSTSTSVNPRPTRATFEALFSVGEAQMSVDIQSATVKGDDARVRVEIRRARTVERNGEVHQVPVVVSSSEHWRREAGTWKLMRDGPVGEEFADDLLAATPADRSRLIADNPAELTSGLRYVLGQRASMAAGALDFRRARELFTLQLQVARAMRDRRTESDALQNIANACYFLRDYDAAAESYRQRLALARDMDDGEATAASLVGLATVGYSRGDYSTALATYRDALALYEARDDGASAGRTLISVGNVHFVQADYDAANAAYRRALSLLTNHADVQSAVLARGGLARVLASQGDVAAALDAYGQVLGDARAAARADPRMASGVAATLESIGEVHFRIGNLDQARAAFDEARRLMDAVPADSARMLSSLGLIDLVAGRVDAALADYTDSRLRFEKAKDEAGAARAWVGVGFAQAARQKFDDAMAAYRTAIRTLESLRRNDDAARAWLGLSMAQSGAGDDTAALESARKVSLIGAALESDDLAWRGAVRAGEALQKLARFEDARAAFGAAIETIGRLAGDAPVNPGVRRQLDDSASAWAGLAVSRAKDGDPRGALDALEERRAHIRRIHLAAFQKDIGAGESDADRADEQSIAREIISTHARIAAERGAPHPDAARLERLQPQLAALMAKRADQQSRLYAKLPELREWRGLTGPRMDLDSLVPASDAVAIEYLVTDDELLILAVDRDEAGPRVTSAILPLMRRDLSERVAALMKPEPLHDNAAWRAAAEPVRRALVAPIADRLRDRARAIVVPDDVVWKVPIEALPDGDGDLAARLRITYATSLATLAAEQRVATAAGDVRTEPLVDARAPAPTGSGTGGAPGTAVAAGSGGRAAGSSPAPPRLSAGFIAAPLISSIMRAELAATQPGWTEPDADATRARAEEDAKMYADNGSVKTGAAATKPALRALQASSDVLQISAPVHVSGAAPLFTSVLLAGAPGASPDDERWEAREWFALPGRARVLVLDDASTVGAAGASGAWDTLAWAAAAAGVSTMVVGRWPADAFALDVLERAFHAQLSKGQPPGDAWDAAVRAARESSAPPAAWAGLRLIGLR